MNDQPRQLCEADLGGVMTLSRQAGWNQTRDDWTRVMAMEPEGCVGIEQEGRIVATATAVCFGDALAWIGMVLTDPAFRGRGLARRLMVHTLDFLARRGVAWIKLDATDMGRPLYLSLGFTDECVIERFVGRADPLVRSGPPGPPGVPAILLDRQAFGADRGRLLDSLAPLGAISISGVGYAMSRPGAVAAYFGPCVARTTEGARRLLSAALAPHAGNEVYWDVLHSNPEALRLARESGFAARRTLSRMILRGRPSAPPLIHNDACVFAIAGFEYG